MESEPNQPVDGDVLLHLNFVPKWARGASTANPYADFAGSDRGRERDSRDRSPSRGGSRPERGGRDRDRAPGGERRMGDRSSRPSGDRFPRSDSRAPHTPASRPEPAVPNALQWVEVRFLPERRALGAAVKRIQKSRRAFPLSELAGVFLSNPDFHQVKLEFSRQAPPGTRLAQCDLCGRLFLDASAAREHVAGAHREDFFTVETRELPPPTGVFTCVARCRIGNILLGPPNHHSFNDRLMELHSTRFSNLSLDEFRRNIETVHDPEVVEAWKTECRTEQVLLRKDDPEAKPVAPAEARAWLAAEAPRHVRELHRVVVDAAIARQTEDRALQMTIREAWAQENRFPMTLMIALRPALRHMGVQLFKAGGNVTFVSSVSPSPLDPSHAVEPIRNALAYLDAHPGCSRAEMLHDLFPAAPEDDPARHEVLGHLQWLADKGHVIEFFNGALAIPSHLPTSIRTGPPAHRRGNGPSAASGADSSVG